MRSQGISYTYSAFISYCHRDVVFARMLQSCLENYRLPRNLRNASELVDPRSGRLRPVFRDRDELTAAPDLSAAVCDAIRTSAFMVVVCTPRAPGSAWVLKELDFARERHGGDRALAALFEGDAEAAFPPGLRSLAGDGTPRTPLAADFRKGGDGRRLALLKLVAAIARVPLDALVQRDAQRRRRRIVVTAVGAALVMTTLLASTALAVFARQQALNEQQRGVATVAMLVEQRKRQQELGRLDLLQDQDRAAVEFFRNRNISTLPIEAQLLAAKLLQGVSEDEENAGDLDGMRRASAKAWEITNRLLAADPKDPSRILAHAQSEYWVGACAWRGGALSLARDRFAGYAALAGGLAQRNPKHAAWRREAGDADSDLATFSLRTGDLLRAGEMFRSAQEHFQAAARLGPYDADVQSDLADGYGWLADVERLNGRLAAAQAYRTAQRRTLLAMRDRDPDDARIEADLIKNTLGMARVAALERRWDDAVRLFESGRLAARERARRDRANADIAREARGFDLFEVRAWLDMPPEKQPAPTRMRAMLGDCSADGAADHKSEVFAFCTLLRARVMAQDGSPEDAKAALAILSDEPCAASLSERWNLDLCDEHRRALFDIEKRKAGGIGHARRREA